MNEPYRVELFGGLRVHQGDRIITRFRAQKNGALLAYLAYHVRETPHREALMEMLWPEVDPRAGRFRLNTALSSLRRQLEPVNVPAGAVLIADRFTIRINPAACSTDVAAFERQLQAERQSDTDAERLSCLTAAVELYRGELLPGHYEAWIEAERARLADANLQALRRLIRSLVRVHELDRALDYARRLVNAEPLREESHRTLMRLYIAVGRPMAARQQYLHLERLLLETLGATPSAALREMAARLSAGSGQAPIHDDCRAEKEAFLLPPVKEQECRRESIVPTRLPPPVVCLPLQFTPFFGRVQELRLLRELLSPAHTETVPSHRLITLTGPGGTGKTRLAVEAARQMADAFSGVWFVPLADLTEPLLIPAAVVEALRLPHSPEVPPLEQAAAFLNARPAPALLVLDNLEHLLYEDPRKSGDGAAVIKTFMERVPGLTQLVTSRQLLSLEEEREFAVDPLPTPGRLSRTPDSSKENDPDLTPEALLECASARLFVDRAQAAKPDFQVTTRNVAAIAGLCDRLEGLPLAIQLAAARAQVMTPAQMLSALEHRFDFLISRRRDATERHRTLKEAIEWSYRLLFPEVQGFLARLSVFRGGWTQEAAQAVCGTETPEGLASDSAPALKYLEQLRDCSLVLTDESDQGMRFRMLETLREFGADHLSREEREAVQRRHFIFFLNAAERGDTDEWSRKTAAGYSWLTHMTQEQENLRAAFAWALVSDPSGGLRLAAALRDYWLHVGKWAEGRVALEEALEKGRDASAQVRSRGFQAAGIIAYRQGDHTRYQDCFRAYLRACRQAGDPCTVAFALFELGSMARTLLDFPAARRYYRESLKIYRDRGDTIGVIQALTKLAHVEKASGRHEGASRFFRQALTARRAIKAEADIAYTAKILGFTAMGLGDLSLARTLYQECLAIWRTTESAPVVGAMLAQIALIAYWENDMEGAEKSYAESLAVRRRSGDIAGIASCLNGLGLVALHQGALQSAGAFCHEALGIRRSLGDTAGISLSLTSLGRVAASEGAWASAIEYLREGLVTGKELDDLPRIAATLEQYASVEVQMGHGERAVRLFASAAAIREQWGLALRPVEQSESANLMVSLRRSLCDDAFTAAWRLGRVLDHKQAIAYALEEEAGCL